MHTLAYLKQLKPTLLGGALFLSLPAVHAIDLIEDFNGAEIDSAVWEADGNKTASLTGGSLVINDDGPGNWDRYDIKSEQRFFIPEAGQSTTFEWVLGVGSVTAGSVGQSIRYQIGIESSNEGDQNPEHYWNSTGGIWIDLDNIDPANTSSASGSARFADDMKTAGGEASFLDGVDLTDWNWESESRTLRLVLTDTDYTWYDGDTQLATQTLADAGIDTEFANGFRVLAIGMNFDDRHGSTSFEKITVTDGQGPSSLLQSFTSQPSSVYAGQKINLLWQVDPDASVSIDQEIGNVDGLTSGGSGTTFQIAPETEVATQISYTITVTKAGEESVTRQLTINVIPAPELSLDNLSDDFSSNFIDTNTWREAGPISNTVTTGVVTWDTAGGWDWAHGEIDTQKVFPIPPAGATSTITWNLGPAVVSADSIHDDARGNRPVMGIASAFETETYTLQHYQNTKGGLWMDIANMSNIDKTSAGGSFHYSDDTKIKDQNAPVLADFTISNWNWETEDREFSLILTDTGYTWMDGTTELATGTYAGAGLDTGPGGEFSKGFRVMFAAVKYQDGSGTMSLNSINIDNGGVAPGGPPAISSIVDNGDGTVSLTWNSKIGVEYAIETSETLEEANWQEFTDGIIADATTETFTVNTNGAKLFYRVQEL